MSLHIYQLFMFSLQHKTALITGGASGIGLAIAKTFAQAGASVHILDLNGEQAEQATNEIRQAGGQATGHVVDIANQAQTVDVINGIAEQGSHSYSCQQRGGVAHRQG